jgi:hypothetical protein
MARTSPTAAVADRHPVDEMLPVGQLFLYGLQHVMSMYAGVVAVPLIVGVTPEYDVPGGVDADDATAVPGAVDTDDQGSVIAREYDARHRRERRTPDDVLGSDRTTGPTGT